MSSRARLGLIIGIVMIAVLTAAAFFWVLRVDYQVLFSNLSMQDTAVMTAELDRLKVPYRLADGGTSILVDKEAVLPTRLKLMGKEIPLHGAVGFELFNNTDFGMTEFAQKINYQRALQGELTRTIQSMSEIKEVRVHIAIPEQSLFKQANSKTKAAITLALKQGEVLHKDQISGIQRLVAAAVPGMAIQDVTIVDEHGAALTRTAQADGASEEGGSSLDLKKETEIYLSQKVTHLLDAAFGRGQSIASVDVSLNMDQVRSTQESVLAPPVETGQVQTGVIVRERETSHDSIGGDNKIIDAASNAHPGSSQRETEYQVGKRVEQIVTQPGSVEHIQVLAVVRKALDINQQEQIRKLIGAAVGASIARGDVVEVQSLSALGANATNQETSSVTPVVSALQPSALILPPAIDASPAAIVKNGNLGWAQWRSLNFLVIPALLLLIFIGVLLLRQVFKPAPTNGRLSEAERRQALDKLKRWMRDAPLAGESS